MADEFVVKDSGARESFDSGMVRDTEDGKLDYSLVLDGPMFKRWAAHLTKGAQKYAPRNWMKAAGEDEYDRFKRSFLRHAVAYLEGARDEDHAAAMFFNINGMEYVREKMAGPSQLAKVTVKTATTATPPLPEMMPCALRYSHGPHYDTKGRHCRGLAFDLT